MSSEVGKDGAAQDSAGISIVAFITALGAALIIFGVQAGIFMAIRVKLSRIFKPKTYLVPERERTDPPPASPWGLMNALLRYKDREIIKKSGLDAYFFLRYLQTLLVIFIPIAVIVIPILLPINFVGGISNDINVNTTEIVDKSQPSGLDTLAWGNLRPTATSRRWAHLILALLVIIWVCFVVFTEFRVYIKIRQDYLTSAEHRLRASANTVMVNSIPEKWLSEEALRGLFDVFPGGIRNVWLTRDFSPLLEKIQKRDAIHQQLESAETEFIRNAKRKQLKQREAEEKKNRRLSRAPALSKAEREEREKKEDADAHRRAENQEGISAGDHEDVPQIDDVVEDAKEEEAGDRRGGLGGGIVKVGRGLKGGVNVVGKAGQGVLGGAKAVQSGVDKQVGWTGGFGMIDNDDANGSKPPTRGSDRPRKVQIADDGAEPKTSFASEPGRSGHVRGGSDGSALPLDARQQGNTTRKVENFDDLLNTEESKWWQFWKPPTGAYLSPVPQGYEGDEFPLGNTQDEEKSTWAKIKGSLPFIGDKKEEKPVEYPSAYDKEYEEDKDEKADGAEWSKWLKPKHRPTHRLPIFEWTPGWLPGLPFINKKTDTIYWCRRELARLNMEIEEDQKHPERYPLMSSAFIQFNNQVAAHMACQSTAHHVPKNMAPRMAEISPNDVIWENMQLEWWNEWLRTLIVIGIVFGMTILWAFPVAFTSSIAQIDSLVEKYDWLKWLQNNETVWAAVKALAGVLPPVLLAVLLALVPIIFNLLAGFQGAKTGAQKSEYVQQYYFFFLFVQVFLVVSIANGAIATLQDTIGDVTRIPDILAQNLPKASNYFFTYMILQALSTSSGTLLQIGTLFVWYILARILDNTARSKWRRQVTLPEITWGSFFPVYTNFACIALVYCVIAPLIAIFAIITFGLLWVAHRYNMIYVTRFKSDTGGVLYPRALNQTFTGLYFMEICLVGLFFLVRNEKNEVACAPQAIIMIVAAILTAIYQYLLNVSFGPLFRYLPITFEDEAVLRDEAFQRAQDRRLGLIPDDDEATTLNTMDGANDQVDDIEMRKLNRRSATEGGFHSKLNPVKSLVSAGSWAARGVKKTTNATFGTAEKKMRTAADYRKERRMKDLESQRAIGEALYGGYHDEIEDLTPEERDALVREAFKHSALRARRPMVWIPRDDLGVSDDEVMRTRAMSEYIWISNEGTALDSKVRVIYGRAPPDFSDIDLIAL